MPRLLQAYAICVTLICAVVLTFTAHITVPGEIQGQAFATLIVLGCIAYLYRTDSPSYVLFRPSPAIFLAASLLLNPLLALVVIVLPHALQSTILALRRRLTLLECSLQATYAATYVVAGQAARQMYVAFGTSPSRLDTAGPVAVGILATLAFVSVNRVALGPVLGIVRNVSVRDSGIFDRASILTDIAVATVGLVIMVIWRINPWLTIPVFTPIAILYTGSLMPSLVLDAQTDYKTGLYSLRHFNTLLIAELDRAKRFGRPFSLLLLDIDDFDQIAASFGQANADYVLASVGQVLRRTLRQYDISGRYDRDKFAVLAPETDPEEAALLVHRLREAVAHIEQSSPEGARKIDSISACVGVACFPADGNEPIMLWHAAEAALEVARTRGLNHTAFSHEVPSELLSREARRAIQVGTALAMPNSAGSAGLARQPSERAFEQLRVAKTAKRDLSPEDMQAQTPRRHYLGLLVSITISIACVATVAGVATSGIADVSVLGLLAALAVVTELLQVDLYGRGTVSVSMALTCTAAVLDGVAGVAIVGTAIAVAHHVRQGRGVNHLQRVAFNASVHLLAGLTIVGVIGTFKPHVTIRTDILVNLVLPSIAAGLAYFAIETGLIALAVAISDNSSPLKTWRRQYRWLAGHYVVLTLLGVLLAVAYTQLDVLGILVFAVPVFMMRYGQSQYILHTKDSVGALEQLTRDLSQAALTDSLTGIGNARGFQIELRREADRAARRREVMSVARVNIDDFKLFNDRFGAEAGDRSLATIAALLRSGRAAGRAFRIGGDDFALILPGTTATESSAIMERLRDDASADINGVTVSVGVAELVDGGDDIDQLREQAEAALGDAKRRGRNAVVTFEQLRDSVQITSSAQALAVHQLLRGKAVDVLFQPIWDLRTCTIMAYEALTAPSSIYGLAGPQEAFDIAEQLRRAHDLDAVCREATLARAGDLPHDALLFMNVSPQTLDLDLFAGTALLDQISSAGLTPSQVVLELTERSMARLSVVVREAKRLRALGFKLALDDTGAGNAGLEMLSQLPVDFVKVDKAVTAAAMTSKNARGVLAGIIAIAKQTDTYVIVEGIETIEALDLAWGIRASGVQGYLLGRPSELIPGLDVDVVRHRLERRSHVSQAALD